MAKGNQKTKEEAPQKAFIVCVARGAPVARDRVDEMVELVTSDRLVVAGTMTARRDKPDAATFVGSGKVDEIGEVAREAGASVVIFDAQLTAAQERNISRATGLAVLDRTELILEIFLKRAKSREGRLQVELAKLEHLSTRLVRGWTHLERQRGGLGKTGGPGEKQIELDRRLIASRIRQLKAELKTLAKQRATQRSSRRSGRALTVSVVGYTNAGKSTLFNAMTSGGVYAANQLFATLDTTARRAWITEDFHVVFSDTVGFIRDLPHQLVEAFKSTLDETIHADILLHVVDASSAVKDEQMASVSEVLREIGADTIPTLVVFNKTDLTNLPPEILRDDTGEISAVRLSALRREGLDLLREALFERAQKLKDKGPEPDPDPRFD